MKKPLFTDQNLWEVLENRLRSAINHIRQLTPDQLMATPGSDLIDCCVETFSLEPLQLLEANAYQLEPKETRDGPNARVIMQYTVVVPFSGDAELLKYRSRTHLPHPAYGEVQDNEIHVSIKLDNATSERLEAALESKLDPIRRSIKNQQPALLEQKDGITAVVTREIKTRKQLLEQSKGVVEGLKLPIKRRDVPETYKVPITRKKPKIIVPPVTSTDFKPEPVLDEGTYEEVLDTMQDMSLVMERNPHAFAALGEEHIRTQFLVPLNAHFGLDATGETFNYEGKTDILIKHQGKNVFIAECALWKGDKYLSEKIDQLLGYLSWRDTKAAILLFSRKKEFSGVVAKIPEIMQKHPNFKKYLGKRGESGFRYVFRQRDDANREVKLTVLAFDVPTP